MKVAFVGMGRVGTALAAILQQKGYEIIAVEDQEPSAIERAKEVLGEVREGINPEGALETRAVFLTVKDDAIASVAQSLSERFKWPDHTVFVHTSGSLVSRILGDRPRISFHPLQSFAGIKEAMERIPHSVFALEGDEKGLEFGRQLANNLGIDHVEISPESKPLYHMAACMACNYVVTLLYEAKRELVDLGFSGEFAESGLLSLLKGTVENMESMGVEKAITGPIMRGDITTVKGHLAALEEHGATTLKAVYALLGLRTAEMVLRESTCAKGAEKNIGEMVVLFKTASGNTRENKNIDADHYGSRTTAN